MELWPAVSGPNYERDFPGRVYFCGALFGVKSPLFDCVACLMHH